MKTQNVKWTVSLSNGETVYEEKGEYAVLAGEISPWQRLQKYIKEKGLKITSLSLYTDRGQRFNLPSAGKNPKFKEFTDAEKPTGYRMFRKVGIDVNNNKVENEEFFTVIEATYSNNKRLQIWVSGQNPDISWSVLI
jgi:hypothetical protein